jgi:uracil-DNA glycosylase
VFDSPFWEGLPETWRAVLAGRFTPGDAEAIESFVTVRRNAGPVLPDESDVFAALRLTPPDAVSVVILGQDPYPTPGDAHGLAFSVRTGVRIPRSLANVFRERYDDIGLAAPVSGDLTAWSRQGVLLLNAVLTVDAGVPGSHRGKGWEPLTDAVIRAVSDGPVRSVFLLWGNDARRKAPLIDHARHVIHFAAHPSPLSARRGFFGSRPFSKTNATLRALGRSQIDWRLPGDGE